MKDNFGEKLYVSICNLFFKFFLNPNTWLLNHVMEIKIVNLMEHCRRITTEVSETTLFQSVWAFFTDYDVFSMLCFK